MPLLTPDSIHTIKFCASVRFRLSLAFPHFEMNLQTAAPREEQLILARLSTSKLHIQSQGDDFGAHDLGNVTHLFSKLIDEVSTWPVRVVKTIFYV
jgi:hypothetical protein